MWKDQEWRRRCEGRRWSSGVERREAVELLLDLLLMPVSIAIFHVFAFFSAWTPVERPRRTNYSRPKTDQKTVYGFLLTRCGFASW